MGEKVYSYVSEGVRMNGKKKVVHALTGSRFGKSSLDSPCTCMEDVL
jgi:hypothetical protein